MKRTFSIFLSMLVVSIMLIGTVGAESANSIQDELIEGEYYFPEYGSTAFDSLKGDEKVIDFRGSVPEITEAKEKRQWMKTMWTCINNSQDELTPHMTQNGGNLVGFGTDYRGYIFVEFDNEQKDSIDKSTIDKFYTIIDKTAKKADIADTPVVFRIGEEEVMESRTSTWTNLIGGIKVVGGGLQSTLTFAAEDSSGNKGFVMSGHAAIDAGGIGTDIYQPSTSSGRIVGQVDYYNYVFADAAWVEANNVVDDIYYADTDITRDVRSGFIDPSVGDTVYKSGIKTKLTSGTVTQRYVTHTTALGPLYYQFVADYDSDSGDSGAPVFKKYGSTQVKLVGIHRASAGNYVRFSPISGIMADLDVTPLS